jgi:hypothetical protein
MNSRTSSFAWAIAALLDSLHIHQLAKKPQLCLLSRRHPRTCYLVNVDKLDISFRVSVFICRFLERSYGFVERRQDSSLHVFSILRLCGISPFLKPCLFGIIRVCMKDG